MNVMEQQIPVAGGASRNHSLEKGFAGLETYIHKPMKIKTTSILMFLAWLLAGTFPGQAQEAAPARQTQPGERLDMEIRLKQFLARFPESDANKDGILTREEVNAFNARRRSESPVASVEPGARPRQQAGVPPTHADFAYGAHPRQIFDIWLAQSKDGKPAPLVIHIHGGGFRGGDKRVPPGTAQRYLEKGVSFASINYRLSDVGPYPIMMEDAARCLQTIRHRAREWNLDPKRVACYGGSAGAGISLWLGFHDDLADPDSKDPIARESTRIVAAGATNGQSTYDLHTFREWFGIPKLKPHEALIPLFAVKEEADWESDRVKKLMAEASPITHLTRDDVPVYMSYGQGNLPVGEHTAPGTWVHHVRLGLKLQEAMKAIGLECLVKSPEHAETAYGSLENFLITKVNEGSASAE